MGKIEVFESFLGAVCEGAWGWPKVCPRLGPICSGNPRPTWGIAATRRSPSHPISTQPPSEYNSQWEWEDASLDGFVKYFSNQAGQAFPVAKINDIGQNNIETEFRLNNRFGVLV